MKKLALTIAIALTMGLSVYAQEGGLLNRGVTFDKQQDKGMMKGDVVSPGVPGHGSDTDEPAPLGSGVAVMLGLGAAYLVGKKRNEE